MHKPVIISAKRTAIGKLGGIYKYTPPHVLMAHLIKSLLKETGLKADLVDEVIIGNAVGPGGNLARLSLLEAGLPHTVPGVTVDRQCGSGLEAVNLAARLIQSGAGDIYLAGGVESTSLEPKRIALPSSENGASRPMERAQFSPHFIGDPDMGVAAENVARHYQITREKQDEFALSSHKKAISAQIDGRFKSEIISYQAFFKDEGPRKNMSLKLLERVSPAFVKDGTVTAGNACGLNDGASLILIMSLEKARTLNLGPQLHFIDATSAGVDPNLLGLGPIPAVNKLLKRQNLLISDIDVFEFNEAFASQVIASVENLKIPYDRLNLGGGAIAFGHPYGASGAVLITRLLTEMKRHKLKRGIATLGIAGGLGLATLVERYEQND